MTINAASIDWAVGNEHETSPGVYARLHAIIEDWTVWRFETVNGVRVYACKPAIGGSLPHPLGVGQALWGSVPRVEVHVSHEVKGVFKGAHTHVVKAEMRIVGERFTIPAPMWFDPSPYDGEKIEVFIQSMPTERSYSKLRQDEGVIDFTGLGEAVEAGQSLLK